MNCNQIRFGSADEALKALRQQSDVGVSKARLPRSSAQGDAQLLELFPLSPQLGGQLFDFSPQRGHFGS
jgi:hypothetical protein